MIKYLTLLLLLIASPCFGATYYVTATGDATDPDCSSSSACCSGSWDLSDVNGAGATLTDGDIVYFCDVDGDFRGQFVPDGGTASVITYMAYPNQSPTILGSDSVTSAEWRDDGGNIFDTNTTTYSQHPGFILFGDEAEANVGIYISDSSTCAGAGAAIAANKQWCYNAATDIVYVYNDGGNDPTTDFGSVEIGNADELPYNEELIDVSSDYIVIDGLTLKYTPSTVIRMTGGQDYITIKNCTIKYGGGGEAGSTRYGNGITVWGDATNITVQNNSFEQIYDSAMSWQVNDGYGANVTISDIVFDNNTVDKCNTGVEIVCAGCTDIGIGVNTLSSTNMTISNNTITNSGCASWSGYNHGGGGDGIHYQMKEFDTLTNTQITGNTITTTCASGAGDASYGRGMDIKATATINNNYVSNTQGFGVLLSTDGSSRYYNGTFSYNIITSCDNDAVKLDNLASGTATNIYNNTIYGDNASYNCVWSEDATTANVNFKNNILMNNVANLALDVDGIDDATAAFDYNLYYNTGAGDAVDWEGTGCSMAEINDDTCFGAISMEGNGVGNDPLFNNNGVYFLTKSGSPAIDAGVDVSLTTDYTGGIVPRNGTPDIGAYEFVPNAVSESLKPSAAGIGISI